MIKIISRILLGIMLIAFLLMCLMNCQRKTLKNIERNVSGIQSQISKLDSTYRYNQTFIIQYEKGKAQSKINSMPSDSILKYIRSNQQ